MYRIALVILAASLSVGASRCGDDESPDDSGGVIEEGDGAAGAPGNGEPNPAEGNPPPAGTMPAAGARGGAAGKPSDPGKPAEPGASCGKVTCAPGQECCNASCGICVEKGGFCTEQFCGEPTDPGEPVKCGANVCDAGEECCNASCGICVRPGEGCTKQLCGDPTDPDPEPIPGRPCDLECDAGQHCEYVEVQCIRAPCPPQPECVQSPHCGGFAGFTCPGAGMCEDDPRDDCDPNNGGADCGGICECQLEGLCKDGQVWNASPTVCACELAGGGGGKGEQCGSRTCPAGQVCCNASCGICAEPDAACIQIACL